MDMTSKLARVGSASNQNKKPVKSLERGLTASSQSKMSVNSGQAGIRGYGRNMARC